jgi:hypothetical protein
MEELNNNIRDLELYILDLEEGINTLKKEFELELLEKTIELEAEFKEKKNQELSTIQKREAKALEDEKLKQKDYDISKGEVEIKIKKIELRYLERLFKIRIN